MTSASNSRRRHSAPLRIAALGLLTAAAWSAQAATVTLCVEPYTLDLPGTPAVPMWGYRQVAAAASCSATPGARTSAATPLITVPPGDTTLAVTLVNRLTVPTSIVIAAQGLPSGAGGPVMAVDVVGAACTPNPGAAPTAPEHPQNCRVRSFTGETPPGGSAVYTFANLRSGSYLYQSGTHPQVQIQMGLAGLARVQSAVNPGYDIDAPVLLSEVDPLMHARVATTLGSADPTSWKAGNNATLNYAPRYFLINGKVYTDPTSTQIPITTANGTRVGLRIANAGLQSRTLMLNQGTWRLLNEDGYAYPAPREQATVLVPAGKTTDAQLIASVPATGANTAVALFDRRGGSDNFDGSMLGGQVARLVQSAPVGPTIQAIASPQVANAGVPFSLQVVGSNISGYTLPTAPSGMVISSPGGLITWPAPVGAAGVLLPVTVSGANGATTATQNFDMRVNHAPTIAATGPIAVAHGTVTIAAPGVLAGALDPDGDALSALQSVAASAGTLALNANGGYTWSGPQPAVGAASTAVSFSVVARDPYGLSSAPTTVTLNVAANQPPTATNDGTSLTGRQTLTLAAGTLSPKAPLSITPTNPLNLPLQPAANLQIPLQNILANDTDPDGRVANLQVVSITRGTVAAAGGAFTAVALPPSPPLTGGTWAEASITTAAAGDGTGVIRFVPRTRSNTLAGTTTVGFPSGTALEGGAVQTSQGVYRVIYRAVDDQGAASANTGTFYVVVN